LDGVPAAYYSDSAATSTVPSKAAAPVAGRRIAPVVLEEAIPSEMVSLADLQTLGVRELSYRYDLGDCWAHEITMEKVLPPGEVTRPECLAGRGTTPAEDGGD
jgi:Plasmid pRiA4b ORF-3-like protein